MRLPKFLFGLLIGGLIASIYWYYQKSTSAEDGALTLLDRLAASQARVRDLEAKLRGSAPLQESPEESETETRFDVAPVSEDAAREDDLQQIDGIGPTYAGRLEGAGISTFAGLAAMTPQQVVDITGVRSPDMAEAWIKAAQERSAG
jgi:predicted flap endonuclease-1-like 5' DNA nuclease